MTKPFRPMLSGKAGESHRYPLLASAKLDGIRCLAMGGKPMSRSMKVLPNEHIQAMFATAPGLEGLDGEIVVGPASDPDVYRRTSSGVMSEDGVPSFTFWVFDCWDLDQCQFQDRLSEARDRVMRVNQPWVKVLPHTSIHDAVTLDEFEHETVNAGYEGVMLRSPTGPYKQGRSTTNEGWLLKLKRFDDAEATIIGFEERMHNANEATVDERGYTKRSSHQENKVGSGTLGALVVRGGDGIEFNIGTGFDELQRHDLWRDQDSLLGQTVKFKFFAHGVKDAPRHPVFLGFRDQRDMSR